LLAANSRFIAIPWEASGGGCFSVVKVGGKGKLGRAAPLFEGHKAAVLDVAFNPFNDYVVASAADDAAVKLWKVEEGPNQVLPNKDPLATLTGHSRRACRIVFNPLVDSVLASFGGENSIKLWDVARGQQIASVKAISQQYLDINWSQDGNRLVLPAKDKLLHVYDARSAGEIFSVPSHYGLKGSRAVFYDSLNYIASTGFTSGAARQIYLRDCRNPEKPIADEEIDHNSGILIPFMDEYNGVVYLFGRGDTGARYYELRTEAPPLLGLSQWAMQEPIRAVSHAPRYCVSTSKCEIDRFYVVTQSKSLLAVRMIVPRRNAEGVFQEDLYPECVGPEASIGLDAWKAGQDAVPKLINLAEGFTLSEPKEVTRPPPQASTETAPPKPAPVKSEPVIRRPEPSRPPVVESARVKVPEPVKPKPETVVAHPPPVAVRSEPVVPGPELEARVASLESVTAELKAHVAQLEKRIVELAARNDEIADSNQKLVEANQKLVDANQKLADANQKLVDSNRRLSDGTKECVDVQEVNEDRLEDSDDIEGGDEAGDDDSDDVSDE
jgi:hypothetical protein